MEVLLELVLEPSLSPWMVNKLASHLNTLLKRRDLLRPGEDLVVQWRPLYDLYERMFYSHYEAMGMITYPQ